MPEGGGGGGMHAWAAGEDCSGGGSCEGREGGPPPPPLPPPPPPLPPAPSSGAGRWSWVTAGLRNYSKKKKGQGPSTFTVQRYCAIETFFEGVKSPFCCHWVGGSYNIYIYVYTCIYMYIYIYIYIYIMPFCCRWVGGSQKTCARRPDRTWGGRTSIPVMHSVTSSYIVSHHHT